MDPIEMQEYLQQTHFLNWQQPIVLETAQALTHQCKTPEEKAVKLFYFVRDQIKYKFLKEIVNRKMLRADTTLLARQRFCINKAVLLASMGRAVGIPTRLHFADIINHRVNEKIVKIMGTRLFSYHGYMEFYLHDQWIQANPAFDKENCAQHEFVPVEFDSIHDGLSAHTDPQGRLFIEYVKDYGPFKDVPYTAIVTAWYDVYGPAFKKELSQK